jgi:hypothetical protein
VSPRQTGRGEDGAESGRRPAAWATLRRTLTARKWIVWALAALLLIGALQLATMLIPHNALHSLQSVEDKSNGIQELPRGAQQAPTTSTAR